MGNTACQLPGCGCLRRLNVLSPPVHEQVEIRLRHTRDSVETKIKHHSLVS